ncbi:MAG TPA: NAD(P)-dependent oxidoreductase [Burkholderiaceae bacterium]|nr:NAD(P)-dependent oxidoreductase [Burkholderiaceae bacterium]
MTTTIGFLGLGQMGRPMACNLAEAGHEVLACDRSSEALAAVAGKQRISAARDLRSLAEACSTLILMLPDSRIVDGVLWDEGGLATCLERGALLIDMGSSDPNRTRDNHRRLAEQDVALVDAPVSGGVKRAIDASLSIMAGGNEADFERALPVLEKLGRTIMHVGPVGAGHALKALNNYVSASGLLAVCEALVAAQRFGIDPKTANALFNTSTGRNNTTDVKVEQFMLSGRFDSGFALALMRKDIETARSLMHSLGSAHDFVDACARSWNEAEKTLPAGADHTAMYTFAQQR